ncbi:Protein QNR-71 [Acipenser ruthenus]|uniref:Protein QNR-71 n=1 Tax=Acipenser ruthenus TaxID=7906 RepID=A0A662YK72_ACIRT|nr:Protein QNR-71 [Acipenser ruthenus]
MYKFKKSYPTVDASVHPGESVYNGTSWIDDYGFGNCSNKSNCNVFPDGKPFPQRLDWRRNSYVYVWHTMGQYYQKHDRSVSSITLNTTNITLGAQLMELSVYRKSNRRKYSPAATASGIYFVTDQIPFIVNISQKNDRNASDNVFIKDADIVFNVKIHDPSYYLKVAEVSYKWDFNDGNMLITPSSVATHAYNQLMNYTVKLTVEAIFKVPCGPATPTPTSVTSNPVTAGIITVESVRTTSIKVSTASVTDVIVDFLVKCNGSIPTSACTIILDSTCKVTKNIICDKVPAADQCQLTLHRAFNQSGIFCVNITLSDSASLALASTHLTIGEQTKYIVPKEASVIAGAVLVVLTAVAGLVLYKRYKEYKPVNGHPGDGSVEGVTIYFSQLKVALFPGNEERNPLLQGKTDSD